MKPRSVIHSEVQEDPEAALPLHPNQADPEGGEGEATACAS